MALFDTRPSETDEFGGSDVATRALSVTAVENDFVAGVYEKLASVYDFTFGPTLHAGRLRAKVVHPTRARVTDVERSRANYGHHGHPQGERAS